MVATSVVLKIEKGPQQGREFVFASADRFLVGRARGAHLRLPDGDPSVSRNHCLIEICPPNAILHDLQSTNGTFVNGAAICRASLKAGDEICIGTTILRVMQAPKMASLRADAQLGEEKQRQVPLRVPPRTVEGLETTPLEPCVQCQANPTQAQLPVQWRRCPYLCARCVDNLLPQCNLGQCGEYALIKPVGQGGMGLVYVAWHQKYHRLAALKRLKPLVLSNERARQQFRREIAVLRELNHPNIVCLLDEGREEKEGFLVSEYMAGGDLEGLVKHVRRQPLSVDEGTHYLKQVLDGLLWAHERGFVHRDIKPANILLTAASGGTAKVSDFGLAKGYTMAGMSVMTKLGEAAGTLLYMAPEQILNFRFVKPPSDLYSVGVSFYYLITGQLPFNFPSPLDRLPGDPPIGKMNNEMRIVLEDDPIPVRERMPGLPQGLAAVIDKSIRKDERERFHSAADMKRAIEQACLRSTEVAEFRPGDYS